MFPAGTCVAVAGPSLCDIKRFIPYELSVGQLVLFFDIFACRPYEGPLVSKSALVFVFSLSCLLCPSSQEAQCYFHLTTSNT